MYKIIGHFLVYLFVFSGLYGCSCSEQTSLNTSVEPGLYITALSWDEDGGNIQFPINLQRDNQETVSVTYQVAELIDRDAKAGEDFVAETQTVSFSPSDSDTKTVSIQITDDDLYEHDESFVVKLTASSGAKIINAQAIVTIIDNEPKPVATLSIVDSAETTMALAESDAARVQMKITLNKVSGVNASLGIQKSEENSEMSGGGTTAAERVDYLLKKADEDLLKSSENIVIPPGETSTTIYMDVIDDGIVEKTESFNLSLTSVADVTPAATKLAFEITDDDTPNTSVTYSVPLNDSGVREVTAVTVPIEDVLALANDQGVEPQQAETELRGELEQQMDYHKGRDAEYAAGTLTKVGDGRAGFDFTKLDSTGNPTDAVVPEDPTQPIPWDCVRDNNTGLVWEVKTRGNLGLRAQSRNFYWFDPSSTTNGGDSGDRGEFFCAKSDLSECNTAYYVADINASKLCGLTGWRLPTMNELRSIFDYGLSSKANPQVYYDTDYFATEGASTKYFWTSSTFQLDTSKAWVI
ncbi:MAG: Calx-beta domain-containing protein, partial [Gammaproteobacteria bacterium]|nr:Calx-beta domain-containing protein [Gammaproteobacteria bacterium]